MAFSVNYEELDGYPRSSWESGDFEAERRVLVAWSDRVQFLVELDTYPNNLYPYADGPSDAIVRKAKIFPFDAPGAPQGVLATYQWAIVQIIHSTRGSQYVPGLNVSVKERFFPAYQYSVVAHDNLEWASDGERVLPKDAPRRLEVMSEYIVELDNLLTLPTWVLTRKGITNIGPVAPILMPLPAFAPQSLMYNGCTIEGNWSLGKTARFTVVAHYMHKPDLWNRYWRSDASGGPAVEQIKNKDGDNYIQQPLEGMSLI